MGVDVDKLNKTIDDCDDAIARIQHVMHSLEELSGDIKSKHIIGVDMDVYLKCIDRVFSNLKIVESNLNNKKSNAKKELEKEE